MFLKKKQPAATKIEFTPLVNNDDQFKIPFEIPVVQEPTSGFVLVEQGCKLKADLNLIHSVRILGEYIGNVNSSSEFLISKVSKYIGNVNVKKIRIFGAFEGEVRAESVELAAGSKFKGVIRAAACSIHKSCAFEGKLQVERA